jgi:AraC family transcriptional regulator
LADFIEANLARQISLGMLGELACMSEYHLARMFRISFGMPPSAWVAEWRVEHARRLLKTTSQPLQQIADACGYADLSHFSHRFRDSVGAPPSRYRSAVTGIATVPRRAD